VAVQFLAEQLYRFINRAFMATDWCSCSQARTNRESCRTLHRTKGGAFIWSKSLLVSDIGRR
jgi:hypothetical protein